MSVQHYFSQQSVLKYHQNKVKPRILLNDMFQLSSFKMHPKSTIQVVYMTYAYSSFSL